MRTTLRTCSAATAVLGWWEIASCWCGSKGWPSGLISPSPCAASAALSCCCRSSTPPTRTFRSAFGSFADASPRARLSSAGRRSSRSRDDANRRSSSFSRTVLRRKFSRSSAAPTEGSRFRPPSFFAAASCSAAATAVCGSASLLPLASVFSEVLMPKGAIQLLLRRLFKFLKQALQKLLGFLPGLLDLVLEVRGVPYRGGQRGAKIAGEQPRDIVTQEKIVQAPHNTGHEELPRAGHVYVGLVDAQVVGPLVQLRPRIVGDNQLVEAQVQDLHEVAGRLRGRGRSRLRARAGTAPRERSYEIARVRLAVASPHDHDSPYVEVEAVDHDPAREHPRELLHLRTELAQLDKVGLRISGRVVRNEPPDNHSAREGVGGQDRNAEIKARDGAQLMLHGLREEGHPCERGQSEGPAEEEASLGCSAHAKFSVTRTIASSGAPNCASADHGMSTLSPGGIDLAPAVTVPATTLRIRGWSRPGSRSDSPLARTTRRMVNSSQDAIVPEVGAALTRSGGPSSHRIERNDSST